MEKKDIFTRVLAVSGTVFVWLPIAAPVLLTVALLITTGFFRFDWLMPVELFPLVLGGGLVLLWAALRARRRRGIIAWGLGTAFGMLFAGQGLAVLTGLASGDIGLNSTWFGVVAATLALYALAVIFTGIGGIQLVRDLFGRRRVA